MLSHDAGRPTPLATLPPVLSLDDAARVDPSGPRCPCGAPITRVPGKRTRVYCSEACKKRGQRAAKAAAEAAVGKKGHLGKETTEFRSPLRPAETSNPNTARTAAAARKSRRYAGRRTLWQISTDRTCRGCGRTVMDPESGIVLAQTAEGTAVVLGTMKCGKIWLCPVCSANIRNSRAAEISAAVVAWIARGGTALLVTFTARHAASDRLDALMDAIQGTRADADKGVRRKPGAYQRLITGAAWAGDARRAANLTGIRGRSGFIGMIRATEVTVGEANGWHPHIHAIVFLGGETTGERGDKRITGTFVPSELVLDEFRGHFRSVWTAHLAKVDRSFKPSDRHGVDFKPLATEQDAQDLSQYIAKLQDGSKAINPANELARGDLKSGRQGNMAPFQMLGRIGDLMGGALEDDIDGQGDLEWCLARWFEYEAATKGRRAIEWTRYLRPLLGLEGGDSEEDDVARLFEMDAASPFRTGVAVKTTAWHRVAERALDLAVTQAAEVGEWDTVTDLVVASGSSAASVRVLTTGEITEAWETTLARMAERREAATARRKVERAGQS